MVSASFWRQRTRLAIIAAFSPDELCCIVDFVDFAPQPPPCARERFRGQNPTLQNKDVWFGFVNTGVDTHKSDVVPTVDTVPGKQASKQYYKNTTLRKLYTVFFVMTRQPNIHREPRNQEE